MRRRRVVGVGALVAVLALGGAALFVFWPIPDPPPHVTREDYSRIKDGMTEAEVLAILGTPGHYRTGPPLVETLLDGDPGDGGLGDNSECLYWLTDTAAIWLVISQDKVIDKQLNGTSPSSNGFPVIDFGLQPGGE
jgi:hypothetical protein